MSVPDYQLPLGQSSNLAAAGSTQGTATQIVNKSINISSGTANQGLILPAYVTGDVFGQNVDINNPLAVAILIYPDSGGAINGGTTNAGYSLAAGYSAKFVRTSATNWQVFPGTVSSGGGGSATGVVKVQKFTGNGTYTYTPSSGMITCTVEGVAAGGGGGGTNATTALHCAAGSGGSGGEYFRLTYTSAQIGASATVVIGAGGTGSSASAGTAGGNTTFTPAGSGQAITVVGGQAGALGGSINVVSTYTAYAILHAGGLTGGSHAQQGTELRVAGGASGPVVYFGGSGYGPIPQGGFGGSSYFGAGAPIPSAAGNGNNAPSESFGSGGSGAIADESETAYAGGNGTDGCIIITEYT